MSQLHLEPVRHPASRLSLAFIGIASAAVLVVGGATLLTAGFGRVPDGAGGPPAATSAPTPTAAPSTPSPAPPSPGPITSPMSVTGSLSCSSAVTSPTKVGKVDQYRHVEIRCVLDSSDSHVTGNATTVMDIDEMADGSADIWGTSTIAKAGGSWTGAWRGTVDAGYTTHHVSGVYTGSGAYAGLRFSYQFEGTGDPSYRLTGIIEPVDTIPLAGTQVVYGEGCSVIGAGSVVEEAGVTTASGIRLGCTGQSSDPRLAGDFVVVSDITVKADQSADLQGSATITGSAGSWTGSWSGTIDVGYTTQRLHGQLTGTGAYAGLTLSFSQIGIGDELGYVLTGTILPAS